MELLSGKMIADRLLLALKERLAQASVIPGLAVILVGDELESQKYVGLKEARAAEVGIRFEKFLFPSSVLPNDLIDCITTLNSRADIHGIIVQLPLPHGLPTDEIIAHIDPKKDTDGFHPETLKRFLSGDVSACPVFPRAIVALLRATKLSFHGEKAIAVVNSNIIGRVLAFALSLEGLSAEYVLSADGREALAAETRDARVVVTACGIPDLLDASLLSTDAVVIDGGNVHVDGVVQGDVNRSDVESHVAFLSPVPGGVGPVTVATLLARVTDAALQ
ncbi:MAG: bifunctional 5,10-methylenetetrahydrofolate dehydrogenase/5,10-methenyltetrahydrofolate cyclohydrolase [Candidatus Moranbacteria bacterium]|jgi:methylenetetrahydrofolate dehydrogenase (NADP+)/methenyltetrahydrofolate cyclohydrolase|nr:bifunctional 5,10-methylenetetrahydrofolate dehydrogenase/5,10-methenyltetrahydrofolate cyclohydrolase [Candidatus Moranbacteria bacterium]